MPAPDLTLIVGHLTDTTARIWIQGSASHREATVTLIDTLGHAQTRRLTLGPDKLFTGILDFEGLLPDTGHTCLLQLASDGAEPHQNARGGFCTFPQAGQTPGEFVFGLVSCHERTPDTEKDYFKHVWERARGQARFMIHAGDNIYYDKKPNEGKKPTLARYARTYNRTWGKPPRPARDINRSIRTILSETANYMILDDHDITNNFTPTNPKLRPYFEPGRAAYELFQHAHNPDTPSGRFYYSFAYGDVQFFVMDVRLERNEEDKQMISLAQERAFLRWARRHASAIKFVVTPVPILGQTVAVLGDKQDKWCGKRFRDQRNRILSLLAEEGIERLVFLTGDMHATYHLRSTFQRGQRTRVYHELMASPVNHFLRSRLAFNADKPWSARSWEVSTKGFSHFSSKKSSMMIRVHAATGEIRYTAFRTDKDKTLWSDRFHL